MTASTHFDQAALLLMDFQGEIVEMLAGGGSVAAVERAAMALRAAREVALPVVYVTVGFRLGHPEASLRNKRFAAVRAHGRLLQDSPGARIVPELSPRADEPVVIKRRVGALAYTELQPLLSALEVRTLVLCGLSTSGVVLSTVRQAADADYRIVVLSDACADGEREVHEVLMGKVFPTQAEVLTTESFVEALARR